MEYQELPTYRIQSQMK